MEELSVAKKAIKVYRTFQDGFALWAKAPLLLTATTVIFTLINVLLSLGFYTNNSPDAYGKSYGAWMWLVVIASVIIGSWGHIAIVTAADKADKGQNLRFASNILGAPKFLLRYLGAFLLSSLILVGIVVFGALLCLMFGLLTYVLAKAIGTGVIALGVAIVGSLLVVVVGISGLCFFVYFGVRLSMWTFGCILDNLGPVASLKSSFSLVRKWVTPLVGIFALMFAASLVSYLLALLVFLLLGMGKSEIRLWGMIWQQAMGLLMTPLFTCVLMKLYGKLKELVQG